MGSAPAGSEEAAEPAHGPADGRDRAAAAGAVLGFSFSLGSAGLVLPLLALASGYDASTVGLLTATSAIAQFGIRLKLPQMLAIIPDRTLIASANAMMVVSFGILVVSRELPVFAVAQLLQGGARAMFWTGSQTHAVRSRTGAVRSLAMVQVLGNVGTLAGPAAAGFVAARSMDGALVVASAGALLGILASLLLLRLEPYPSPRRGGGPRIWRRPGVDLACWASYSAGGWRAMLSSFVPVALSAAGQPPALIGTVMATTEAAGMVPPAILLRRSVASVRRAIEVGVIAVTIGLATFPFLAGNTPLAAVALFVGGLGSGLLTALGPALASQSVGRDDQGEAIAVAGTFRAAALLITPAVVSAALVVVALPVGMVVAAAAIGAPPLTAAARMRRVGGGPQ